MLGSQDQTVQGGQYRPIAILIKNSKCNESVQEEQKVVIEPIRSIKEGFSEEVTAGRMAGS